MCVPVAVPCPWRVWSDACLVYIDCTGLVSHHIRHMEHSRLHNISFPSPNFKSSSVKLKEGGERERETNNSGSLADDHDDR